MNLEEEIRFAILGLQVLKDLNDSNEKSSQILKGITNSINKIKEEFNYEDYEKDFQIRQTENTRQQIKTIQSLENELANKDISTEVILQKTNKYLNDIEEKWKNIGIVETAMLPHSIINVVIKPFKRNISEPDMGFEWCDGHRIKYTESNIDNFKKILDEYHGLNNVINLEYELKGFKKRDYLALQKISFFLNYGNINLMRY